MPTRWGLFLLGARQASPLGRAGLRLTVYYPRAFLLALSGDRAKNDTFSMRTIFGTGLAVGLAALPGTLSHVGIEYSDSGGLPPAKWTGRP